MRRLGMVLLAILFLFMVFAGPAAPKSEAVVVSTVVIGTVIAAMAAAGIGLTVSGMTSAQLSDWVGGKLNDWATSIGGSVQDHIDNNLITVTGRGILSIGTAAANGISDFISWLTNNDSIQDNSTQVIQSPSVMLNGYKLGLLPLHVSQAGYEVSFSAPVETYVYYRYRVNGYYGPRFISKESTVVTEVSGNETYQTNVTTALNGYYYSYSDGHFSVPGNGTGFDRELIHEVPAATIIGSGNTAVVTGGISYETQTISVPTIGQADKWFLDVGADPGVTVDTVTDGVIADTIEGTLTVSGEVAEEEPEIEIDGPIGISGLTEVFPFCIPFDVYDLLSCLSADPQTPIFTVRFVIPGIINEEFTIDLTPFNAVAQIVRTMELLVFAIGLALVTRERFLRS